MKKIIQLSILLALATIFSIIDKFLSQAIFVFLPTIKMGLANIIILFCIYKYNFKESFTIVLLKSILTGLIFGSIMTFIIGFSGTVLSFLGIYLFKIIFKNKISIIGYSMIGGILHIIGQLVVTYFIYELGDVILYYGGYMILVSVVTSIIIGVLSKIMINRIKLLGESDYNDKKDI